MLITQPRNLAGAANPLHGSIQPKRQHNPRVRRRVTRSPVHYLDGRKQRRHIEPLDETPHQTHPVIVRQKPIQADRAPSCLHALSKSQPRQPPTHALPILFGTTQLIPQLLQGVYQYSAILSGLALMPGDWRCCC